MMSREIGNDNASRMFQTQPDCQLLQAELAGVAVLLEAALREIGALIQARVCTTKSDELGRSLAKVRLKVECAKFNVDRLTSIAVWSSPDV